MANYETYTCYSIKQFKYLVENNNTPISVVKHKETGRNGFVFLLTPKLQYYLNKY